MRTNKRTKRTLHSAMKTRSSGSPRVRRLLKVILVLAALAFIGALCWLCALAFSHLKACWEEQCIVTDEAEQVSISATPHVKAEYIKEWFSLSNGCNLAHLDLNETRERVLREHPIVKELTVARHLPNRIEIAVEERKPIARINLVRPRTPNDIARWDVVDVDGIVFEANRKESRNLPVIIEKKPSAQRGERISWRALVALRLAELCVVRNLISFDLPEISTDSATYLKATTANYSTVQIAWSLLDDARDDGQPALTQILTNLQQLMNQGLYPDRVTYTITELDRIAVRTNE